MPVDKPLVSVLMPVYNAGSYLKDAIDSILNQSYRNIEFLIINDGSTDNSADIISSYTDNRIRVINNEGNKGIVYSLNVGLKEAKGEFIARMDSDDISLRERIGKQVDFMAQHPAVGVCGTFAKTFGAGKKRIWKYPKTHEECAVRLLFHTCFCHPSVIFRKEAVEKADIKYKPGYFPAEDIELWAINSDKLIYANIPEVLIKYRTHRNQTSLIRLELQNKFKFEIQLYTLKKILSEITEEETDLFKKIAFNQFGYTINFLNKCETLFVKILANNLEKKIFDCNALEKEIQHHWFDICTDFSSNGVYTKKIFKQSPLVKLTDFSLNYVKFCTKNFLINIKVI